MKSFFDVGAGQVARRSTARLAAGVAMVAAGLALATPGRASADAPAATLSVYAGTGTAAAPKAGPAASSPLYAPTGVALDAAGNLYIADSDNNVVEKVTPQGNLSVVAGSGVSAAPHPGPATSSPLGHPVGVAVDGSGDLFIADLGEHVVEKVTPQGTLSVFAGSGASGTPHPGPATSSTLGILSGVAVDASGDVYIADESNHVVEKVTPQGTLSVFAGSGASGVPKAGPATSSPFGEPFGVAVDASGDVFIADLGEHLVVKVTPQGTLSMFAGSGASGVPKAGPATSSPLAGPASLGQDAAGDVYISDLGANEVAKVTPDGNLSVFAGTGAANSPKPGPATSSPLNTPSGVVADAAGDVFLADDSNNVVEKIVLPAPSAPTISNIPHSAAHGGSFVPTLASDSDGAPSVTSNTPLVCEVVGSKVEFVGAGKCSLTPHVAIGTVYGPASGSTQTFEVAPPPARCSASLASGTVVGMAVTSDGYGYWIASSTGQVAACGDAPDLGNGPAGTAAIATATTGNGYWLVTSTGTVYAFGSAVFHGGIPSTAKLAKPIVAMAADPATGGYWLLGGDGGVFSYHAPFFGSTGNIRLARPAVGLEATPDGLGYRFVAADGGIFDYGDARYYGSTGGVALDKPIVGMADDPATGGYWLDAADGGIFSFHAPFYGSTGRVVLDQPCVGMTSLPDGLGYRFVAADGGIFDFSATYEGSAVG